MNSHWRTTAIVLWMLVFLRTLQADDFQAVSVAVEPARIELAPGVENAAVTYRFTNSSSEPFEVLERAAYWHSLDNDWRSRRLGPYATAVNLPSASTVEWRDRPRLWAQIIDAATQAQGLGSRELLLVQHFTLRSASGGKTHVAASLVFRLPATDTIELPHYRLTVLRIFREDATRQEQLAKLTDFADAAYEKLQAVLGIIPNDGRKVPLRITTYGGNPHYSPGESAYMSIPCNTVESQDKSEWLWVVYPHELVHYFLLQEFPGPPRWFVEGPASFFGNKVAEQLGWAKMTAEDRAKILGWGADYERSGCDFLFADAWPQEGPQGKPQEIYNLGLGRGYAICTELEALCGPDFFRQVFQHMRASRVSFTAAKTEKERIEILLSAMQTQTAQDLWAFFAQRGFRP